MSEYADLSAKISKLLEGMPPLEQALVLVNAMREASGMEWAVDARADGSFVVRRVAPDMFIASERLRTDPDAAP